MAGRQVGTYVNSVHKSGRQETRRQANKYYQCIYIYTHGNCDITYFCGSGAQKVSTGCPKIGPRNLRPAKAK